jgi:hypothetical protein
MMTPSILLRVAVALLAGGGGLLLLNSFGSLQLPTVLVYSGITIALAGFLRLIWKRRPDAFLAGAVLVLAGLFWPAGTHRASGTGRLDVLLPNYHFHEFHDVRVHATPDRAMEAVRQVTFAELGVMKTLGRIRNIAMGKFSTDAPLPTQPILGLISARRTGFFPLADNEREYIFGMAGQPWNNAARPVHLQPEEFVAWMPPGQVKIASNVRVEDAGNGWSRVVTETRVLATDEGARRTMARYWRLIYPGSGMIRQSMLTAIKARAEQTR